MIPSFAGIPLDRPILMGIVNVTPDSFSDGGQFTGLEEAVSFGRSLALQGASILDIGGESTRPGAASVTIEQEIARAIPVVRALAADGLCVSIDTRHAPVMRAALEAGASIINDVSALEGDPYSLSVAAGSRASVVLMHMRGTPATMQDHPAYEDAPHEIFAYLAGRIEACLSAGIPRERICVDPGIGFGKTLRHNLDLLAHLDLFHKLGVPVLLGVSRKSLIAALSRNEPPQDRLAGSIAAALAGIARGVQILRVHDVAETAQAVAVWHAINQAASQEG
ncbi:MAG TPA: dihydropteroate synthase [Magnetospirillaceae bacterium]|nr:dihydropteroate synthase [Magnetospirillaceae bacterium]